MKATVSCILAGMLVLAAACRTWQVAPAPAPMTGQRQLADHAKVRTRDGRLIEMRAVLVKGDSLIGTRVRPSPAREAVALADVESVEVLRVHGLRTAGTVMGIALVAVTVALVMVLAEMFKAF